MMTAPRIEVTWKAVYPAAFIYNHHYRILRKASFYSLLCNKFNIYYRRFPIKCDFQTVCKVRRYLKIPANAAS